MMGMLGQGGPHNSTAYMDDGSFQEIKGTRRLAYKCVRRQRGSFSRGSNGPGSPAGQSTLSPGEGPLGLTSLFMMTTETEWKNQGHLTPQVGNGGGIRKENRGKGTMLIANEVIEKREDFCVPAETMNDSELKAGARIPTYVLAEYSNGTEYFPSERW